MVSPRYYSVDPMLLPSGNPFKCHEEVLYLQPMIPPSKSFDVFSLTSEGLDAFFPSLLIITVSKYGWYHRSSMIFGCETHIILPLFFSGRHSIPAGGSCTLLMKPFVSETQLLG